MTMFADLVEYVTKDVLNYLTLEDRIRLSRVSKLWAEMFNKFWKQQTILYFTSETNPNLDFDSKHKNCFIEEHRVRQKDIFVVKSGLEPVPKIIVKCPNLIGFYWKVDFDWEGEEAMTKYVINVLMDNCIKLEHLAV